MKDPLSLSIPLTVLCIILDFPMLFSRLLLLPFLMSFGISTGGLTPTVSGNIEEHGIGRIFVDIKFDGNIQYCLAGVVKIRCKWYDELLIDESGIVFRG